MSSNVQRVKALIASASQISQAKAKRFYKTGEGSYAAHDRFIGLTVPTLRTIAKQCAPLNFEEILPLMHSPFNEERFLALLFLIDHYEKRPLLRKEVYAFYIAHIKQVNNWNLVDLSAHKIVGRHLLKGDRSFLHALACSESMWERRIAIVATWAFTLVGEVEWTFKLSQRLLDDTHDLIHKSVGWMLREAGKKDERQLREFLKLYQTKMPRVMYRYAIERLIPCIYI